MQAVDVHQDELIQPLTFTSQCSCLNMELYLNYSLSVTSVKSAEDNMYNDFVLLKLDCLNWDIVLLCNPSYTTEINEQFCQNITISSAGKNLVHAKLSWRFDFHNFIFCLSSFSLPRWVPWAWWPSPLWCTANQSWGQPTPLARPQEHRYRTLHSTPFPGSFSLNRCQAVGWCCLVDADLGSV